MKPFLKVMKALSDPSRVKIMKMLQRRVMCVCEIQAALEIAQSTASKHLKILEDAGLITYQKEGLWVNYALADGNQSPFAASLIGMHVLGRSVLVPLAAMLGFAILGMLPRKKPELIVVETGTVHFAGAFKVEFLAVNHSIIDGAALAISTETGTIIHTGDFKIDFSPVDGDVTDIFRFADYGEKGVLLLMSDSTNALRKGYTRSESILSERLFEIFSSVRGRIIVATFASYIHRIQQVLDAAQKYNKRVVISGITMLKNVEIARSLGYLAGPLGLRPRR